MVVPAWFAMSEDCALVHAANIAHAVAHKNGEVVVLHVDTFDPDRRRGWSVSLAGIARVPTDVVGAVPRAPWLAAGDGVVMSVPTDLVWGRRYEPAE